MSLPTPERYRETVNIPGLGDVPMVEMAGRDREAFDVASYAASETKDFAGMRTRLIVASIDDAGAEAWLDGIPGRFIEPLYEAACRVNGMGDEAGKS